MKHTLLMTGLAVFGLMMSSCTKDEEFDAGWDASLESEVTFDTESSADISMGVVDFDQAVRDYLQETQGDVKTYNIMEIKPTSGVISTTNVVPLDFLDDLDIYAVADGTETLIGMTNPGVSGEASRGIDFVDINLEDLADDDDRLEIVLRPSYAQGAAVAVPTEVSLTFVFSVQGTK